MFTPIADLPAQTNFASYGPNFASMLAAMQFLTDEGHASCPEEWRNLSAYLHELN